MPQPVDPLDPFKDNKAEKTDFKSKDIRRSFARTAKELLMNVFAIGKKAPHVLILIAGALAIAVIVIIGLTTMSDNTPSSSPTSTGQDSKSGTNTQTTGDDLGDPEAIAAEQEKLSTVLTLISQEDWEYAAALIETISPKLLNDCNKLHYYRSISTISDHFDGLSITKDVATMHIDQLENACVVVNE